MDNFRYASPATFQGRLQRGRGRAALDAPTIRGAADIVYECVIVDSRWDLQTEQRDSYLARLIHRLDLPLAPIEQHLFGHTGEDSEEVNLSLQVLALLPFTGRADAAAILRRYAVEGRFWAQALEVIDDAGTWKISQLWTGLDRDVLAAHDDAQLAAAIDGCWGPWNTWARTHPRIRRILDERTASRPSGPARRPDPDDYLKASTTELTRCVITRAGDPRQAIVELGRRGDLIVLDLAEDPSLRNALGWIPGMPKALDHLGTAAVARARSWIGSGDETLETLAVSVLSEFGDRADGPYLMETLITAVDAGAWCMAETPAKGLGRLGLVEATDILIHYWETTIHSSAREAILEGLHGCALEASTDRAVEALDDCEPGVQRIACGIVPVTDHVRERLLKLREDPLAPEVRDAAARHLEKGRAAVQPR